MEAALVTLSRRSEERQREYEACLRGEGCPAELEAAEAALLAAKQRYDEMRQFPLSRMLGGATRDVLMAPAPAHSEAEVHPVVRLGLATLELISVLAIVATGVATIHFMQYDACTGVDGSGANFEVYNTMASFAGEGN